MLVQSVRGRVMPGVRLLMDVAFTKHEKD